MTGSAAADPAPADEPRDEPREEPRDGSRDDSRDGGDAAPRRELLTFRLGAAHFGVWIDEVLEIVEPPPISRLPLPTREVAGVTSIRGDVIPVLDLGVRLLDVPAVRPGRMVLVRHDLSGSLVALLVDEVETLVGIAEGELREPPAPAEARLPIDYMTGVATHGDDVVTVLHLGRAAAPPGPPAEEG